MSAYFGVVCLLGMGWFAQKWIPHCGLRKHLATAPAHHSFMCTSLLNGPTPANNETHLVGQWCPQPMFLQKFRVPTTNIKPPKDSRVKAMA